MPAGTSTSTAAPASTSSRRRRCCSAPVAGSHRRSPLGLVSPAGGPGSAFAAAPCGTTTAAGAVGVAGAAATGAARGAPITCPSAATVVWGSAASWCRAPAALPAAGRSAGSVAVMASSSAAHPPGSSAGSCGRRCRRAIADSRAVPGYSWWPVRHSSRTRARAYTSAGGPTSPPVTCSGDRYAAVPSTRPLWVSLVAEIVRAMPKSASRTRGPGPSSTLSGLTSRCTTSPACT